MDFIAAQNAVAKRFASKLYEAKEKGVSLDSSSEFALHNTYLKFVACSEDERFVEDFWDCLRDRIGKDCGNYVIDDEETTARDFFKEAGEIARKCYLYFPHL